MTSRKNIFMLRFINAILFILLIFVQYNGVFSIKIGFANPSLPLSLLICTAMFSSELTAAITGLVVGIFVDGVASTPTGFNAILFLLFGLSISLIVRHLFNNNIYSAIALCSLFTFIYLVLRWAFCLAFFATLTENLTYIMQTILPSVLYTTFFSIPFYFCEKALYKKFYK